MVVGFRVKGLGFSVWGLGFRACQSVSEARRRRLISRLRSANRPGVRTNPVLISSKVLAESELRASSHIGVNEVQYAAGGSH